MASCFNTSESELKRAPSRDFSEPSIECSKNTTISENQYFIVLKVNEVGCVLLNIRTPTTYRYGNKAPIILVTPTFFTPSSYSNNFTTESPKIDKLGAIEANLILPSRCISKVDDVSLTDVICSEGEKDQGGELSQRSMFGAIRYLTGNKADASGKYVTKHLHLLILKILEFLLSLIRGF